MVGCATPSKFSCRIFQAALLSCVHPWPSEALFDPETRLESARLYGNVHFYGYYFVDLLVGSPPQVVSVILDTGSQMVGFPCKNCKHCGRHIDPPFDFEKSSSAAWIQCDIESQIKNYCIDGCVQDVCSYATKYTEGSTFSGLWFRDVVRLGDIRQRNPAVHAMMGCHVKETKLFYTQRADGILGMGPGNVQGGKPTILQDLFGDDKHIASDIFSICLALWGGRLTVGGHNASLHGKSSTLHWLPMTISRSYNLVLREALVNSRSIAKLGFGPTIVDSGTTYTYFPGRIFDALTDALLKFCNEGPGCRATQDRSSYFTSRCWKLDTGTFFPDSFPPIVLEFGQGVRIHWSPRAYLYKRDSHGTWCYSFQDNGAEQSTVLGASWMLFKDVIFDFKNSRLGVIDANCPEYWRAEDEHFFSNAESLAITDISEDLVPLTSKLRVLFIAAVGVFVISVGIVAAYRLSMLRRTV